MATLIACPKCSAKVSPVYTLCPECFSPIPKESAAAAPVSKPIIPVLAPATSSQLHSKAAGKIQTGFPWVGIATVALVLLGGATLAVRTFSFKPASPAPVGKPGVEAAMAVRTNSTSEDEPGPNARQRAKMASQAIQDSDFDQARNHAEIALSLVDNQLDSTASSTDVKECHEILLQCELNFKQPESALSHAQWLWNVETQHSPEQVTQRQELLAKVENSWLERLETAEKQPNKALRLNHLRGLFQMSQDLGLFENPPTPVRKELAAAHLDAAHISADVKDYYSARIFLNNAQIYGTRDSVLAKMLSEQPKLTIAESRPAYSVAKLEQPKPQYKPGQRRSVKVQVESRQSYPVAIRHSNPDLMAQKPNKKLNPDAEVEALLEQRQRQAPPPTQPAPEAPRKIQLPEIKVETGANSNSIPGYYGNASGRTTLPGY